MSSATQTAQHGLSEHSHGAGVPIQTRYERLRSTNVADFPPVTPREEQWRYLSADRLAGLDADSLAEFIGDLAVTHTDGVTTAWVGEDNAAFGGAGIPEERPSAAAWGSAKQAYLVTVPGNQKSDVQIALSSESADPSAIHIIIEAKPFAEATVILDHKGHAVLGENVEIIVGDEAQLTVISIQDWDDKSVHASTQMARLGRNSRLKHLVVSLGGKVVRVASSTEFTQPGGDT